MRRLVLGTAGHIDHGKTALVRALTGTDTDRLPDEKRRGITIDLGFASLALEDGVALAIVDVPGHEAFVRNMLAGATGIDLVLLVVAADEGVMPQTREHLDILELLGVRRGIVALTKSDLVEAEWLDLVEEELRELMADTVLRAAPVVRVSARTGAGLDDLRSAIGTAAAAVPARSGSDLFRMPIDRAFTVRGTGTVVTGTVWSGTLRADAQVHVLPAGIRARVRALQRHGTNCDEIAAGTRAAVALGGVDRAALSRGDTLLADDGWTAAGILTVHARVLPDGTAPLRPRQRVRVHLGTAEVFGRIGLLDAPLHPGGDAILQLRLESPIVARAGDRFVLRSYSPVHTIAGGTVLEPVAPKRKRLAQHARAALDTIALAGRATPADLLHAAIVLAGPQGLPLGAAPIASGLDAEAAATAASGDPRLARAGGRLVLADLLHHTADRIRAAVARHHDRHPMLDGIERDDVRTDTGAPPLFDDALEMLLEEGTVVTAGNALALPEHSPEPTADARAAMERIADLYHGAGLQPPDLADLPPDLRDRADLPLLVRFLERDGRLLRLSATRLMSPAALSDCIAELRGQMSPGQQLTVADFKDVLKLTRKHLIPLLEHLDRSGVTRRLGDVRVLAD